MPEVFGSVHKVSVSVSEVFIGVHEVCVNVFDVFVIFVAGL